LLFFTVYHDKIPKKKKKHNKATKNIITPIDVLHETRTTPPTPPAPTPPQLISPYEFDGLDWLNQSSFFTIALTGLTKRIKD
jgi:hypothetical protein